MASIKGGNKNDTLHGTASADRIQGLGGDDRLYGYGGNDTLEGGTGDDWLQGGAGSDRIDGGTGTDTLDYSDWSGAIWLQASGYSTDTKGFGTVEERDSTGAVVSTDQYSYIENVVGSSGNDRFAMSAGSNSIWGGAGDDWIYGGISPDRLYGGDGNDLIDAYSGDDFIDGGAGGDTVFWAYSGPSRVIVDLAAGTITYPGYTSITTLVGIENVRGGWGTKEIHGSDATNVVQGSDGPDLIDGRGGDDVLVGDFGRALEGYYTSTIGFDDDIRGGAGNDLISGDLGSDVLTGGSGADIFVVDTYYGSDRITDFEDGTDLLALYGGLTITGWEGRDTNGDEVVDAQAARLSNGQTILFDGHATPPPSLVGTAPGLVLHSEQFAIPELTEWTQAEGASWTAATAAQVYAAAASSSQSDPAVALAAADVGAMLAGAERDATLGLGLDALVRGEGSAPDALHALAPDTSDQWSFTAGAADPITDAMAAAAVMATA